MTSKMKKSILMTVIEVILCVLLVNMDKLLPDQMGKGGSVVVFLLKSILAVVIIAIYYGVMIRPDNIDYDA